MKKQLLALALSGIAFWSNGQNSQGLTKMGINTTPVVERCSHTQIEEAVRALDPAAYDQNKADQEQILQDWITNHYPTWQAQRAVITIPVVVQIWENTTTVPDARVYEQLQTLNEDYRRTNTDASNTPSAFSSIVADCEIEFCLATFDEQGNPTTGIIRHTPGGSPNGISELWDASEYLNMYVYDVGAGLLGFTQTPSTNVQYAVHMGPDYFGNTTAAPYNLGRTTTHEVGHWLNLEHVWGPGAGGCGQDDYCNDTPTQDSENYGCPTHPSASCSNGGDMFMNYMDYVNDNCMNSFTQDQKARMIAAINTYRPNILTSSACGAATLQAEFTASTTTVVVGGSVDFTDQSTGGATTWDWTFTGAATTSSTAQHPTNIVYNNVGCYEVQLDVTDGGSGSDNETKTCYIDVVSAITGCDTLNYPLPGTQVLIGSGGWGYISGDNDYLDVSKANYYDNYAPYTDIDGMYINFAKAYSASGTSTINLAVWDDNAGSPGSIIASETINVSSITTDVYTYYAFSSPVTIPGNFYLGFELSGQTGDTVAVYTNNDGDTSPGTAWEEWSDNSWHNYSETPASWGLNMEHALHPVVCAGGGSGTALSATSSSTDENCGNADGTASVTASDGSGTYTYSWNTGSSSSSINGLTAGTYTCTISDGIDNVVETVVVGSNNTAMTATSSSTDEDCGQSNGSASVTVSGETGSVTYVWSNGGSGSSITGVTAGSYSVTMTDGTGCSIVESVQVSSGGGFTATTSSTDVNCFGDANGTASITPSGASGGVTYIWSNGATGSTVSGLTAGSYSVTATDGAGCVYSSTINISEPASALSSTSSSTDASCDDDGTASVTAAGGTAPYGYLWNDGSMSSSISSLASGSYSCTITDANGCSSVESVSVGTSAIPITVTSSTTNEDCGQNNGTATINATGGSGGLTYAWSNGQTASTAVNLGSGTFTCTITDGLGCSEVETVTVNNNSGFSASVSTVDLTCNGDGNGVAIASGTGGTGPYTYNWDNGETTSAITGLSGGTVNVTVTETTGCSFVVTETIYEPSAISITGNVSDATNNGAANGSITVVGTGGAGGFSYVWSDGQTGSSANGLAAGNYTVTATDGNGCSTEETFEVDEPLSINDIAETFDLVLFPNPTNGLLNISIESSVSDVVNIQVINAVGQVVLSDKESIANGKTTFTVDLSNQSEGMYFINLTGEKIQTTQRVILK